MSLIAALALTANMYAVDNVKVNGSAKLFYGTMDSDKAGAADMFDKDASYGDAALELGVTADLTEGVSAGATFNAVSTLGLENNLVSGTWSNAHGASGSTGASYLGGAQVDDASWFSEAWIAGTALDTTVKVGRQELDTPLAFTEKWGIDKNTFEAAVVINKSVPDTTIVAAWVGKSNGSADDEAGIINSLDAAAAGYVAEGGKFNTFAKDGAYAFAVVNNSFKPVTAQAWYYDLQGLAKAYWLQADLNMDGILAGAQYTNVDPDLEGLNAYLGGAGLTAVDDTTAYSVMVGYEIKDTVKVKAAFSSVDDKGPLGVANTATGGAATLGGQSKLYTEMWWAYGNVSAVGADSWSLTAEATVADIDLLAGYYFADVDPEGAANEEVTEIALTASKSFGPLDTCVALVMDDLDDKVDDTQDETVTTLQVYLTYNF